MAGEGNEFMNGNYLAPHPLPVGLANVVMCVLGEFNDKGKVFLVLDQSITVSGAFQFVFVGPLTAKTRASCFHS